MKKVLLPALAGLCVAIMMWTGCAGNGNAEAADKTPAAVCDSLSESFGKYWTLLREGTEGEAPFYSTPIAFLDKFQGQFGPNCFTAKSKEEIISIIGKPTLVMYQSQEAAADTLLHPEFCYRGFTSDTQMEFTICAFFEQGGKSFKQFSFTRPDMSAPAPKNQ